MSLRFLSVPMLRSGSGAFPLGMTLPLDNVFEPKPSFQYDGPTTVSLEIDFHVALRSGAADQDIAFRRRIERFGFILDCAANEC